MRQETVDVDTQKEMKGIVLAGGTGTRLYPTTLAVNKHLLNIHNKPLIYYPLSTLIRAGINEILIISRGEDRQRFEALLRDGSQWGVRLHYAVQDVPRGIADAFLVGREFLGNSRCALILGDNIFLGPTLGHGLAKARQDEIGATIFATPVNDVSRYGIVELDYRRRPMRIVEKPASSASNWAVTGLYFYDNRVVEIAEGIAPSNRGELEITDVNARYLELGLLNVRCLSTEDRWLDAGTHEDMLAASNLLGELEARTGLGVGYLEEEALKQGYITRSDVAMFATEYRSTSYGTYLAKLAYEDGEWAEALS